ncbi:hypothetical protein SAMN04487996_122162 [Dyadobacter soli]|uniref:Uncharacterized protein n=1 Tax=Dyadobacter soli TaxID=659014 RepID=A0A1G7WTM0_9BACT|nr:hypothetical protein [Dyadobacter soli]SDG75263.1 hypothetical protein SAMN04487996_122162 [Dyadobacter soli]
MPRVKVTYELTIADGFIDIISVIFDDTAVVDLENEKVSPPPPNYKSKGQSDYQIFPDNQFANIKVVAGGTPGFRWSMRVTFTILNASLQPVGQPFSPDTTIEGVADQNGNANFNKSVLWKKLP